MSLIHGFNLDKLLALIAFIFMCAISAIIALTPPASGYEMSIYDTYPFYFWFLMCVSFSCGILVLVRQAFAKEKSNWRLMGFAVIIMVNFIVLFLPVLRGYAIYGRCDTLSHLGYVKDILATGELGSNYYPISHLLVASLSHVLLLDPKLVINTIPAIFNILYILGIYLLATAMARNRGEALLVTAFGAALLFTYYGSMFLPTYLSFAIVPLALFSSYRADNLSRGSLSYRVLLIIFLLLIPFFHPVTSINLMTIFLIFALSFFIWSRLDKRANIPTDEFPSLPYGEVFNRLMILFVTFFTWFSSSVIFAGSIRQLYNWFFARELETSILREYELTIMANFSISEFLRMLFEDYGHELIYVGLSVIATLIIARKVLLRQEPLRREEVFLPLTLVIFGLAFFAFLFGAPIVLSNPQRVLLWVLLPSTLVNGIVFHRWVSCESRNKRLRNAAKYFVVSLLIFSAFVGIFSSHSSALMLGGMNSQVTQGELDGIGWHLEHRNPTVKSYSHLNEVERHVTALVGVESAKDLILAFSKVQSHFEYAPEERGYLIVTAYVRERFTKFWPKGADITASDLAKLDNEPRFSKIYANNDIDIWQISLVEE